MKKLNLLLVVLVTLMIVIKSAGAAESPQKIQLPEPNRENGLPLMQTLQERHSYREFGVRHINEQNLGEILWAAVGINRPDGKRTIPTSRDSQDLDVYVLKVGGAYRYNPKRHELELINPATLTYTAARQDYVKNADVVLVYVSNNPDTNIGSMHAGSAYQNVGLYSASVGLNNVVIGMVDKKVLAKELHLPEDSYVVISQAIGWPKQ